MKTIEVKKDLRDDSSWFAKCKAKTIEDYKSCIHNDVHWNCCKHVFIGDEFSICCLGMEE